MDVGEIALVVIVVLIGFFAKGLTGLGGPMLTIPVLAGFMGVEYAVVVIAIPTFLANCWLLWKTKNHAGGVWWFMVPLLVAGAVGTAIGAWVLTSVDETTISLVLAGFLFAYIVWALVAPDFGIGRRMARRLAAPTGLLGGILAGATGIAAPVVATYVHSLDLIRSTFIFAVTLPFWVINIAQMVSYGALGAYDSERLVAGLIASIPSLAVLPLASRLGEKMSHRSFQLAVLVVLAASAVRLVWNVA